MSLRVRLHLDPASESVRPEPGPEAPVDLNETLPWLPLRLARPPQRLSESPLRCIRCEGRMERGTAPVHLEKEGCRVSWDALPAWVCSRCEAAYFEEREVLLVKGTLALMKQRSVRASV